MSLSRFKFNGSSLLIWVAGLVMACFLISASLDLWGYLRLEKKSIASVFKWKIIEKSSSAFALRAYYTFEKQGKVYNGKTTFSKPYHLNRQSAEKQVKIFSIQSWPVWYQTRHPEHSSIERVFPLKKCIYSLMALGIFFYFVYLRHSYLSSITP
jgi:hypothetical protein